VRVESPLIQQSLIDTPKQIENNVLKSDSSVDTEPVEEASPYAAPLLNPSGIYSPASLRAAVDYHAKFLTVAGNNLEAANHAATIPRAIIERLSGR
jgi:hypothetical protein